MTTAAAFVLGVDGGGTKTVALVADQTGTILSGARGSGSSLYDHADAIATISNVSRQAIQGAGIGEDQIAAATFSLSGADWPADFAFAHNALAAEFNFPVEVINDAVGALQAHIADGPGVVVVCGTGSTTCARNAQGEVWFSGFWQLTPGGVDLGAAALRAICAAELGIGPQTAMREAALGRFALGSVEQLLNRFTAREQGATTGELASLLLDAAEDGDSAARAITANHGSGLGDMVLAALSRVRVSGGRLPLALTGGVFRHPSPLLADAVTDRVKSRFPDVDLVAATTEPVLGAVFGALVQAGVRPDAAIRQRARATIPPSGLFSTAVS